MISANAKLRLFSNELGLAQISSLTSKESEGGHSIGEPISRRNPKTRPETVFILKSKNPGSEPLEAQVLFLIDEYLTLEKKMAESNTNFAADIFCFVTSDNGQGTIEISPKLCGELASAGLHLTFDIYCS